MLVGSDTEETRLFFLSDRSIDRVTDETLLAMAANRGLPAEGLSRRIPSRVPTIQTDWYALHPNRLLMLSVCDHLEA